MIKIREEKRCSCGILYTKVPENHIWHELYEVYHWTCECKSSLIYPPDKERWRALIRADAEGPEVYAAVKARA